MNSKILGYAWEDIQRAQQGGRLARRIDTSRPDTSDGHMDATDDMLLAKYGQAELERMQYMGVLDRLRRRGCIN